MSNFQDAAYGKDHDYVAGSPHLRHAALRSRIQSSITATVSSLAATRPAEVLEIGAGHGHFTRTLLSAGARVTVTEMSKASADHLTAASAETLGVQVVHDPDGRWVFETERTFDAVVCISVLHHIPDYLEALRRYAEITEPGGAFISWQDPLWYPRLPSRQRRAAQFAYYSWRLGQGGWLRGAKTALRRARGVLDVSNEADMVEYHVVRNGVDEKAIAELLAKLYGSITLERYWSTQSVRWQRWGERQGFVSTFGSVASDRLA